MEKPKVAIVGCTGMLGSITLDSFMQSGEFDVIATYRTKEGAEDFIAGYPDADFRVLDAETASEEETAKAIEGAAWVVNAIGVIKPYINGVNTAKIYVTSLILPKYLMKSLPLIPNAIMTNP